MPPTAQLPKLSVGFDGWRLGRRLAGGLLYTESNCRSIREATCSVGCVDIRRCSMWLNATTSQITFGVATCFIATNANVETRAINS